MTDSTGRPDGTNVDSRPSESAATLRAIKVAHTSVWAFFVACILAIPVAATRGAFRAAALLIGLVALEVLVLVINSWRCPLTDVAARYTEDRHANFDIYLPEWLALHNKTVFGVLYLAGALFTFIRWVRA